jgi:hypothetical protein
LSACDELRPKAAGIATLPERDPEREAYLEHARGCEGCMQALREGDKLMRLLESAPQPPPSPEALQRASAQIRAELRPRSFSWALRIGAVVAGFAVILLIARHREAEGWAAALVVLAGAAALAATAGALRAGALVAVAAAAAFAFAAGGVPGPAGLVVDLDCFILELVVAALPLAAAAWTFRTDPRPGALAQAAAAGALAGQAALHIACPLSHQAAHLWVFHVGGVALAALAGWLVEGRLNPEPARR